MTMSRLAIATLGLSVFAFTPGFSLSAKAAEIQLQADLGHSVLSTRKADRTYLRLSLKTLAGIKPERRTPINVALVIDRSGSMSGDRIEAAKKAAHVALDRLSADDIVSLVTYNHKVDVLAASDTGSAPHARKSNARSTNCRSTARRRSTPAPRKAASRLKSSCPIPR